MKYFYMFLIFALAVGNLTAKEVVTLSLDDHNPGTCNIIDADLYVNCGAIYMSKVAREENVITITQTDTSHTKMYCECYFDLNYGIGGLMIGTNTIIIQRQELKEYYYPKDTLIKIFEGTIEIPNYFNPISYVLFDQSECKSANGINPEPIITDVFPNPAGEIITITLGTSNIKDAGLRIINVLGQEQAVKVAGINENMVRLDVSAFPEGLYIITAANGGREYARRIIISR